MARGSSAIVLGSLVALAVLQPAACDGDDDEGTNPVADTLGDVLAAVGPEVVLPTLARAREAADGLAAATTAWAGAPSDEALRTAAQDAWRGTMDAWQEAEVHQVGPAATALSTGGEGLRDEVYSWPTVNPCRVDQETVGSDWASPSFFDAELVDVYGLDALETLLFSPPGVNACPPQVDINANGSWDALGADGVQAQRAAYAAAVAAHVGATLADLEARWDGGFSEALASAGEAGSPYDSPEEGLNAVFDALFYLELRTQDAKLGDPLGLRDCEGDCADLAETRLSGTSHDWIRANLRGFRELFTGGEGAGMDDLLAATGSEDVSDALLEALDDADAAAAALTVPVDVAATTDPAPAVAAYDAIRAVTDLLETDVATILALQIPAEAAGDND